MDNNTSPVINRQLVDRVANLARLKPDEQEQDALIDELNQILGHFQQLEALDTDGISPAYHPQELENVLRDDQITPSFDRDRLVELSEKHKDGCLMVPRTVE